jgi:hypothetical protein
VLRVRQLTGGAPFIPAVVLWRTAASHFPIGISCCPLSGFFNQAPRPISRKMGHLLISLKMTERGKRFTYQEELIFKQYDKGNPNPQMYMYEKAATSATLLIWRYLTRYKTSNRTVNKPLHRW